MSVLLDRLKLSRLAGLMFSGARDLYQVYGYERSPSFENYVAKYVRQDIAQRIIEAPALATWNGIPQITVTDSRGNKADTSNEFEDRWNIVASEANLISSLSKTDILAGLGHYAILLLGLPGDINTPARISTEGAGQPSNLMYVQPYSQASAKINELDQDTSSPNFGKPLRYLISSTKESPLLGTDVVTIPSKEFKAHASRVVHIAERALENSYIGIPRLSAVYNLLDDLLKIAGGSAETYWLVSNRGMQADVDKEMFLGEKDAEDLTAELEEYQHQLRRFIRTRGVTIKSLSGDPVKPQETFLMTIALIAAATGIPQRILVGAEQGASASEADRANWASKIEERRTTFAEPYVLRPLLHKLIAAGVLPPPQGAIKIKWPSTFTLSPLEQAQTMAQFARSVVNLSRQAQFDNPVVGLKEARARLGLAEDLPDGDSFPERQITGAPSGKLSKPGIEDSPPGRPVAQDTDT